MIPCAHVSSGTLRKVEKLTEEQVPSVVERVTPQKFYSLFVVIDHPTRKKTVFQLPTIMFHYCLEGAGVLISQRTIVKLNPT